MSTAPLTPDREYPRHEDIDGQRITYVGFLAEGNGHVIEAALGTRQGLDFARCVCGWRSRPRGGGWQGLLPKAESHLTDSDPYTPDSPPAE